MVQHPLSATQLATAKRQLKGQIAIACDNRENYALDFGKTFLHHGKEKDIDELFARIDAITAADVQQVATDLFDPAHLHTLIFD
jgi:predicted Zn-dependent peptidase